MKKILIFCIVLSLFLTSCVKSGDNKSDKPKKSNNKTTVSGEVTDKNEDDSYSDYEDELIVNTTVKKPDRSDSEIRPTEDSAYLLNRDLLKVSGADNKAASMRKGIINSKDGISLKGSVYYVSPKGNDENDGKSPSKPLKTLVNALSMAKSGDTVLLERGSVFRLGNTVIIGNGITCGAYGVGAKPEIWGSLENYADPLRWNPFSIRNVWAMDCSLSDVGIMVFNHGELSGNMKYYVRNLSQNGDYFFDDVQRVLYLYCDKGNPGKVFNDIEIGSRMVLFRLRDGAKDITIDNISFRYTGTFGIHAKSGCSNVKITNCIVAWIGGSLFESNKDRYGNGIEFLSGCQNINVENCWIYQIFDAGFTFQTNPEGGDRKEHIYKNISLKNSLIEYCSYGFEWWPSDSDCEIGNITVSGNIFRFSGYGWARNIRPLPSHVRGPWTAKNFKAENYVMTGNIFDCSNGPIYAWGLYSPEQYGNQMKGNFFYQKMPEATRNCVFDFDARGDGSGMYYAKNQTEFEELIKKFDSNPSVVKWLN